jgi:UDP-N-acetylmuramate--L-alanine ligase
VRLAAAARAQGLRVVTYGRPERALCEVDVEISDVRVKAHGATARLAWGERHAELVMSVPGEHNVLNAAGAWVAGIECGLEPQAVADGLGRFTGAARRFEARGQVGSRRLFDDYAHHPTEVEAAIREARVVADGAQVTVVFQPHLYSRTRIFAERFARALAGADHVVLAGIYGAREDPEPGVDSTLISSRVPGASYVEDMHEAARLAASVTPEGGVCVTMGAGSITRCGDDVLEEWKRMEA